MLLRSDGSAVACGRNDFGQYDLLEAQDGVSCTQVAAGYGHTVLLLSDGRAVACGRSDFGQCDLPEAQDGVSFTQVSAGYGRTVLVRSDGRAVACGGSDFGQCHWPMRRMASATHRSLPEMSMLCCRAATEAQ